MLNEAAFARAKANFLARVDGFQSFDEPGILAEHELDYKRDAVAKVRGILGPYVASTAQFETDANARDVAWAVFRLTNFVDWRSTSYLDEELLAGSGDWVRFMNLVVSCLKEMPNGDWRPPFGSLLDWLAERNCRAAVSKLVPTYFLFLWDPEHHVAIKTSFYDSYLDRIGLPRQLHGKPLTLERYDQAIAVFDETRAALKDWRPRDNVDIHSFAWVVADGWGKPAMEAVRRPERGPAHAGGATPPPTRFLNVILAGPPGTGKTYRLLRDYIPRFEADGTKRYEFVTFHQSYTYEDFVEGIRPVMDGDGAGGIRYEVQDGIFKRLVSKAMTEPASSYALFIDEINRGNVSNVCGELITLLEDDKRMTWDSTGNVWTGGIQVKLPYTHAANAEAALFGVPSNLFVIGTMNTADRSIALMDLALRRRFTFDEVMPEPELLATQPGPVAVDEGQAIELDRLLEAMNRRIEYLLDRDHTLGHSYLMRVRTLEDLESAFRNQLLPLLQEYFYGDWEKIQLVLADLTGDMDRDGRPSAHEHAIVRHDIQRTGTLLGLTDDAYQDRRSYAISDELTAESFRKIYEGL